MKLYVPATFKLGGVLFRCLMKEDEQNCGTMSYGKRLVQVSPSQQFEDQAATFIHEIIEAANEHYNIGLKHRQIELLERGLYEILRTMRGKINR